MEPKYDYEIIKDYLHGVVDIETARRIGDLIRNDETAKDIAVGILKLEQLFKGREDEVDAYMENFRQQQLARIGGQGKQVAFTGRNWVRIAAGVLIVFASGALLWTNLGGDSVDAIVGKEFSTPYPASVVTRSEGDNDEARAFEAYRLGEYEAASAFFEHASGQTNDQASNVFYHGLCRLYAGNYERAIALLQSEVVGSSRYSQQVRWFLILAFIKSNDSARAVPLLKEIEQNPSHFRYEAAIQLLEAMD